MAVLGFAGPGPFRVCEAMGDACVKQTTGSAYVELIKANISQKKIST